MNKGFSLVELAVVILIIAFLVAGITVGSNLIQIAKIKSIIAEFEEIKTSYKTFESKYDAIPGDMRNASAFFIGCASGGVGNLNCNGNGDGHVTFNMEDAWNGDAIGDEPIKAFRHLRLSNIYQNGGTNTLNLSTPTFGSYATEGYHAKAEAIEKGYFIIVGVDGGSTGNSTIAAGGIYETGSGALISNFDLLTNAVYIFGDTAGTTSGGEGAVDALTAFRIDQKIDDGKAVSGTSLTGATTGIFRTINDVTGSNPCITGANYNISEVNKTCIPGLKLQ